MTYYNFKTGTYETSTFDNSDYGKAMEINIKFNYCLKEFKGNIFAALLAYYNGIEEVKERISTEVAPKYGWDYETFLMYETGFRWCIYFSDFPAYNQVESVLSKMPTDYPIQFQMKLDDGNIHFYQAVIKEDISSSYQDVHAYNFVK